MLVGLFGFWGRLGCKGLVGVGEAFGEVWLETLSFFRILYEDFQGLNPN